MDTSTADTDEERVFLTAGITERESAKELARLRHSGPLDRLLGVDKFWTEKMLLFVLWVQDFALIWIFPSMMWPWHFWGKSHIVVWSVLDFQTRRIQMKPCDSCTPWPDCSPSGCAPTLEVFGEGSPSDATNSGLVVAGALFFLLWLLINKIPEFGIIGPALARNLERIIYPLILFFYTPYLLRSLYVFCDYDSNTIENWRCTPNVSSVPWFFIISIYGLGLPWIIIRRVSNQQLFKSGLRHETYMRTRELEYKLGLSTSYRDKKLWIMSSFTGFGCYSGAWFMIQRLLIVFLIYLCTTGLRTSSAFQHFACGVVAVLYGFQALLLLFVFRVYRVKTSHWTQVLFMLASAFNAWIGFLQSIGARLLSDKDLRILLSAFNLSVLAVFVVSLFATFFLVHDFLPHRGTAGSREVEKFKTVVPKVRLSEDNMMHMHLGKSLKMLILNQWKIKVLHTRRKTAASQPIPKVGNKNALLKMEVRDYREDDFCCDIALFGELMIHSSDVQATVVSEDEESGTNVLHVRLSRLQDTETVIRFVQRCNQPGDLMRESLNVVSAETIPFELVTVSVPLSVIKSHFNTMFVFTTTSSGDNVVRISKKVNDHEELAILNKYIHKTIVMVDGIKRATQDELRELLNQITTDDSENGPSENELVLTFDSGETPDGIIDQCDFHDTLNEEPNPSNFPQRRGSTDYELNILQTLLNRSDELTDAELFSPTVDSEEQVFKPTLSYFFRLNSNARYMWPVSQSLVTEIKRENETNHFLDILKEANAILMEVSFMHDTPELIRIESLLFHIRRIARCLKTCTELRVAHHLNAIHPLAPTFESVLDNLVFEFKLNKGKSLAMGRRAQKLPIVSAFLHHRMNERQRTFVLVRPVMLRVLFKLLVLRMFIELVSGKRELLPEVVPSPTVEIEQTYTDTKASEGRRSRHSALDGTRGSRIGFHEITSRGSFFSFGSPVEIEEDETLSRLQLTNEEVIKRKEIMHGLNVWFTRCKTEETQHQAKQLKIQQTVLNEEVTSRNKILREEKMAWKAWIELSEDLMKSVRDVIRKHKEHCVVFKEEISDRDLLLAEEDDQHQQLQQQIDTSMSRILEDDTERRKLLEMQAAMKARKEQQQSQELERQKQLKASKSKLVKILNSWKEKYKETHGQYPTKKVLASNTDIAEIYNKYLSVTKEINTGVPDASISSTPSIEVQPSPDVNPEPAPIPDTTSTPSQKPAKTRNPLKARKAELVKILNSWKAEYREKNGKDVTKKVLKTDPTIKDVYTEYLQVVQESKRSASPAPSDISEVEDNEKHDIDEKTLREMPLSELKKLVKDKNKKLNEWKSAFAEKHGKQPTKTNLRQASEIVDIYDLYVLANPILKSRKAEGEPKTDASQSAPVDESTS